MKKYLIFSLLFLTIVISGCSNKKTEENNLIDDYSAPVNLSEETIATVTPVEETNILKTKTDNIYTDVEKQIAINFIDGYKKYNDIQIGFGPLGDNLGPDSATVGKKDSYHFQLDIKDYKTADKLFAEYEARNVKPEIINVSGFKAVKYAEGSICEDRVIEVIGKKYNYHFAADGCVNNSETDFNYLTKTIEQLRILE